MEAANKMNYTFLDKSVGLLLGWDELYGLIIFTFALTFLIVIIYKYTSNQEALRMLREDSKRLSEEMKQHKDDPKKMMELQKEQFRKAFFEQFKHTMVPMVITLIPMAIVFFYLKGYYAKIQNPALLFGFGWIFVYILFSILFNMILRKLLKVH